MIFPENMKLSYFKGLKKGKYFKRRETVDDVMASEVCDLLNEFIKLPMQHACYFTVPRKDAPKGVVSVSENIIDFLENHQMIVKNDQGEENSKQLSMKEVIPLIFKFSSNYQSGNKDYELLMKYFLCIMDNFDRFLMESEKNE